MEHNDEHEESLEANSGGTESTVKKTGGKMIKIWNRKQKKVYGGIHKRRAMTGKIMFISLMREKKMQRHEV